MRYYKIAAATAALATVLLAMPANAGWFGGRGLGGDLVEGLCGGCGLGRALDDAHDGFKRANPSYGKAEEKLTNDFRQTVGLKPHCEALFNKWGEQVGCR